MKAVEGIYDGNRIKPLEPLNMPANVRVIITFPDMPRPALRRTRIEDVAGCLSYRGPAKSLADMEQAIEKGAQKQQS
jgi:hypothetical protein